MPDTRIAFIGTGIMGCPMAHNLLAAGYGVTVHTRTASRAQPLLDEGAIWADTPAVAASQSDVVITCVPDTPDVEAVLLGPSGVVESARPGLICIDMSTISPAATEEIGSTLAEKGATLLDAPISGGQVGAIEGKLSIMIGGPYEVVEKVRPILEVMGRKITHCGDLGNGQLTKLTNQVMVIHTIMSIAEGLAFARAAGLDLQTTFEATSAGAAASHSLTNLGPKIIAGDFKPAFMVDLQLKDLRLVMEYAHKLKQPLPGACLAKHLMTTLQAQGYGTDGTQALFKVIRDMGPTSKNPPAESGSA